MNKRISSLLLAFIMLFSLVTFSACFEKHESTDSSSSTAESVKLTPKENFLKLDDHLVAYVTEMSDASGTTALSALWNQAKGKIFTTEHTLTVSKLSFMGMDDFLDGALEVTGTTKYDVDKNKAVLNNKLTMGDGVLPVLIYILQKDMYFSIENIEGIFKIPSNVEGAAISPADVQELTDLVKVYFTTMFDEMDDSYFTSETKDVMIKNGETAENAEVITLTLNAEQVNAEARKVVEKAKNDTVLRDLLRKVFGDTIPADNDEYKQAFDDFLAGDAGSEEGAGTLRVEMALQDGKLRKVYIEVEANGEHYALTLYTAVKEKTYTITAEILQDRESLIELKASITKTSDTVFEGSLTLDVSGALKMADKDATTEVVPETMAISGSFKSVTTDNKQAITGSLQVAISVGSTDVTYKLPFSITIETVSETELKLQGKISGSFQGVFELDIELNATIAVEEYKALDLPSFGQTHKLDDEDVKEYLEYEMRTKYPEFYPQPDGVNMVAANGDSIFIYNEPNENGETIAYINLTISDLKIKDGTFSGILLGYRFSDTYIRDGDEVTFNELTYSYEATDSGHLLYAGEIYIEVTGNKATLSCYMVYKTDKNFIYMNTMPGYSVEAPFKSSEDSMTINGIKFILADF